jgi:hypothetical protein
VRSGRTILLALCLLAPLGAQAQQITVVAPSAAQRCLTRGEVLLGTPTYPQRALEAKASGRVTLELEFSAPDAAPKVLKIDAKSAEDADLFEASVREFVKAYRVPCLRPEEKSVLNQEFVFLPHDLRGVTMMASQDEQSQRTENLRRCMKHLRPDDKPAYPSQELRAERQGTAVVRAEFVDAEGPPRVTVLDDGGSTGFENGAREHALRFRMPCHDGAGPVEVVQLYQYRIAGASRVVLSDMQFLALLRTIKGIRSAVVYFDFNTMACPFDVHFVPMQPHALNQVGEVGPPNPERRFFLDWLSRQQLDLPRQQHNAVIGQHARVTVPCMVLNLGPRAGGGASQ